MKASRHIQIYGTTDVGCIRSGNEDCFLIQVHGNPQSELNASGPFDITENANIMVAVADGMGGAAAGEVASSTALKALRDFLAQHHEVLGRGINEEGVRLLESGIQEANHAIAEKSRTHQVNKGMGATITAAYISGDVLFVLQIGDSRAYVFREGRLYRITRDQSFVGHLVEMGTITEEQALKHPQRNVILQALGTQDNLKVDISYLPLCKNDLVLICSDGLYSEFEPRRLSRHAADLAKESLPSFIEGLVAEAKTAGGKDNITAVGIRVADGFPSREPGEDPRYIAFPFMDQENPLRQSNSLFP